MATSPLPRHKHYREEEPADDRYYVACAFFFFAVDKNHFKD